MGAFLDTASSYTVLLLRIAHRKWKETKQQPDTAGPGNMLFFPFPVAHPVAAPGTELWLCKNILVRFQEGLSEMFGHAIVHF